MEVKLEPNLEQQFDLNLIEAVKMNPVIYDRSHYNYKHFVRKSQIWKQIADSLGVPEQKCTKRWKSLRDKFAREMKLSQGSRWRYFKQMQFLVESIRQYRESLLVKCGAPPSASQGNSVQVQQVDPNQQQQQQQQAVMDIFGQPFNGNATTSTTLAHPHVTGDTQLVPAGTARVTYEPVMKRERGDEDNHDNTLSTIKIFQNTLNPGVSAEDQSFGMVVTDMLNTLGVRQKAEAKVHIIKYLTDMQLLAQHNKY